MCSSTSFLTGVARELKERMFVFGEFLSDGFHGTHLRSFFAVLHGDPGEQCKGADH
jgi:hypothetical protein